MSDWNNNWFYLRLYPTVIFYFRISRNQRLMWSRARGWKRIPLESKGK